MKKAFLIFGLTFALVTQFGCPKHNDAPSFRASQQNCENSGGKAPGCSSAAVSVPEPSGFMLLGVGLAVVGGAAIILRRKHLAEN